MLKCIQAELKKTRHNMLYTLSAALCVLFPLLSALKDLSLGQNAFYRMDAQGWMMATQDVGLTILLNVLSGLIITLSVQKEYADRTIIFQLTTPISRTDFLLSKLAVWALWHLVLTLLFFLSAALGALLLDPGTVTFAVLARGGLSFVKHGFWLFLALLPLPAAAILQKGVFYPPLLLCLGFTISATMSAVLGGILPFALPWSAARLLGTAELDGTYLIISAVSVLCCAALGLFLSLFWFRRQKL